MEENQENKDQEQNVQEPEMNEEVQENTDNLADKEADTDKNKRSFFIV